jgi:hypothetical protein
MVSYVLLQIKCILIKKYFINGICSILLFAKVALFYYLSMSRLTKQKDMINRSLTIIIFLLFSLNSCNAQVKEKKDTQEPCVNREPVVAGSFYPKEKAKLTSQLQQFFKEAESKTSNNEVAAIIAPHAGYVYSGKVAASSYNQIDPAKEYQNIFILAPSHRVSFNGASIYSHGNYETPLGEVKVNRKLARKLIDENQNFVFNQQAHAQEHSLEVQLPFLQHHLKSDFQIIPIVIGTRNKHTCKKMAEALEPYFNPNNLFVISTDFSHYPDYQDAKKVDEASAKAVVSNSPEKLLQTIQENSNKQITNLATSMCGWPAVLTVLNITSQKKEIAIKKIDYQNSGDITKNKRRVVGYWSIAFYRKNQKKTNNMSFQLNDQEKETLLKLARESLRNYLSEGSLPDVDKDRLTPTLKKNAGAFVTLHKDGKLRGCIGRFNPDMPLFEVVQKMAVAAATRDTRFANVLEGELDDIDIEISVLTPMKKTNDISEIELGRHGIYVKKGMRSGTFLPQVADKTEWTKEEFLGHCARDKAGIGWEGWKDADVYTYEAIIFEE